MYPWIPSALPPSHTRLLGALLGNMVGLSTFWRRFPVLGIFILATFYICQYSLVLGMEDSATPSNQVVKFDCFQNSNPVNTAEVDSVANDAVKVEFTIPGGAGYAPVLLHVQEGMGDPTEVKPLLSDDLVKMSSIPELHVDGLTVSAAEIREPVSLKMTGTPQVYVSTLKPTKAGHYMILYRVGRMWEPSKYTTSAVHLKVRDAEGPV